MGSIFSKIIGGEIPCYKVAETKDCFAFLDIYPNTKGHTLCVTKSEIDNIFDLPHEQYNNLMHFSRKIGLAIQNAIPCKRTGIFVIGLEVPHVHVHLIPLNSMEDATFQNKVKLSSEEMQTVAESISEAYQEL